MQQLALFFLVAIACGGLAWVFIFPILSGERQAEQRRAGIARPEPAAQRQARGAQKSRRDAIEGTIKEMEQRHKKQKQTPLPIKLSQAGLNWTAQRYYLFSALLGLFGVAAVLFSGMGLIPAIAIGFAAAFGVPAWLLKFFKARREAKFLDAA
jgi:tight adherence protein B